MLPLLKRYSDDIRAAHMEVIDRSPMSLREDMVVIEETFCTKLIGELKGMTSNGAVGGAVGAVADSAPIGVVTSPVAPDAAATPVAPNVAAIIDSMISKARATVFASLKAGGLPTLATLKWINAEDASSLDELIEYDRERSLVRDNALHDNALHDDGYCGYANYAHVATYGIDYLIWVIERGFYLGALDVCLVVRNQTYDHSFRIILALH